MNCHVKFGIYKKLSRRRQSARRFIKLKILLRYSKIMQNYNDEQGVCRFLIVTMCLSCTVSEIFSVE